MTDTYPHEYAGAEAGPPAAPSAGEIAEGRRIRAALLAVAVDQVDEHARERRTATPWRCAGAIDQLFAEADAANPARDRRSDGTIGNLAHAANWTGSDHNPFIVLAGCGVVRAGDVDVDGLDLPAAVERARAGALAGSLPQFVNGGYVIFGRRITAPDFSGWRVYTGPNPHTAHAHFSVSREPFRFDNRRPLGIFEPPPAPAPSTRKARNLMYLTRDAVTGAIYLWTPDGARHLLTREEVNVCGWLLGSAGVLEHNDRFHDVLFGVLERAPVRRRLAVGEHDAELAGPLADFAPPVEVDDPDAIPAPPWMDAAGALG